MCVMVTFPCYCLPATDASVSLQMPSATLEGSNVEMCVDLSNVPAGGLERDVVVMLNTIDGTKAG